MTSKTVYIDPSYKAYYEDKLFDKADATLNRDDTLAPFIRLRESLSKNGVALHTADRLPPKNHNNRVCDYYSLGVLDNYERLQSFEHVNLKAFVMFEPPVVAPHLYKELPKLTAAFEHVYVHNAHGHGYSLKGVDKTRLRKLYWPQPHKDVLLPFWLKDNRSQSIVMVNGNHKPTSFQYELYSKRIEALVEFSKYGNVDLYGRGWDRWWTLNSLWMPYWKNRRHLMSIYRGACASKYEVLSRYNFAICFENMMMDGYITEKIFDCLYAGTIPLYIGANDISNLIPKDVYIDCTCYSNWQEIHIKIMEMSKEEIILMRHAGRAFVRSAQGMRYFKSLIEIFQSSSAL